MRNPLRETWVAGDCTYGVGITAASPATAQLLAHAGFDWLMLDLEHGAISPEGLHAMIAATAGTPAAPIVRIPHPLPWLAKTALDLGAFGIVFPTVNSADDTRAAVAACRYPPVGTRQWGPFHAPARFGLSMPDYLATADIVTIVLVEHPSAIDAIEEIVAVPGVDAAVIGTHDLAVALGRPGQPDHPDVAAAVARAESAIRRSPVVLGGNAFSAAQAREMVGRGYQLVALGFDWTLLQSAARGLLDCVR